MREEFSKKLTTEEKSADLLKVLLKSHPGDVKGSVAAGTKDTRVDKKAPTERPRNGFRNKWFGYQRVKRGFLF